MNECTIFTSNIYINCILKIIRGSLDKTTNVTSPLEIYEKRKFLEK